MNDRLFLYFLAKLLTILVTDLLFGMNVDITFLVITTLSFACVFVLELLVGRIYGNRRGEEAGSFSRYNNIILILVAGSMLVCFILGLDKYFAFFMVLLVQMIDMLVPSEMFYQIFLVSAVLSFFIFAPVVTAAAWSLWLTCFLLFGRMVLEKLTIYKKMYEAQSEELEEQEKKLADLKSLMKTLKYTASVEERNRIAARIHDQVGHGISGSIIILEAALLVMKKDPQKASESIGKAIGNLRDGVDDIRTALREERTDRYVLGINDVNALLEEFKVNYNKSVSLKTNGELGSISLDVWTCIHDNLKECLTNVLKHSNATGFDMKIDVFKKIIKVEYKDNGKSSDSYEAGLGLEAIEERTIRANGRCFFLKGEDGFCVTNIFTY